jgi:protein tyrosine/serine phosphatase
MNEALVETERSATILKSKDEDKTWIREWIESRLFVDEKVECIQNNIVYKDRFGKPMNGSLYLTKLQLIFIEDEAPYRLFVIRLRTIRKLKKIHSKSEKTITKLRIFCKDIRTVTFSAPQSDWKDIIEIITRLAFPINETDLPAFSLKDAPLPSSDIKEDNSSDDEGNTPSLKSLPSEKKTEGSSEAAETYETTPISLNQSMNEPTFYDSDRENRSSKEQDYAIRTKTVVVSSPKKPKPLLLRRENTEGSDEADKKRILKVPDLELGGSITDRSPYRSDKKIHTPISVSKQHQDLMDTNDEGDGWKIYNPIHEYARLGLDRSPWKLTDVNHKYRLCDSYPEILVVPEDADEEMLKNCASFRTRNRFPVLSWIHENKSIISRCSQPMPGLLSKRDATDEKYLAMLRGNNKNLYILDVRPKINATANTIVGGGFEKARYYKNTVREFLDIENIHKVRESWKKLSHLCTTISYKDNPDAFELETNMWFKYLQSILIAATRVRDILNKEGASVLVHCSDGWDRTSQVVSIGEILMDPYYRTIEGFQILIEKEWCSFGHQFALREGHGKNMDDYANEQRAPIFLQFIDLVYQLVALYPSAFQFNEYYLLFILDHFHSCMFGTFLTNSQMERMQLQCNTKTNSLWDLVQLNQRLFLNNTYNAEEYKVIDFDVQTFTFRLWRTYYLRWQEYKYPELGNDLDLQELTFSLNFATAASMPEFSLKKKRKFVHIKRRPRKSIVPKRKKTARSKYEKTNNL